MIRDVFIAHFLERIDKKELIRAGILAGFDTAGDSANTLRKKFYDQLKHTDTPHHVARKKLKWGRLTIE